MTRHRRDPRAVIPAALPHQREGAAFLRGRDAAGLFDEQGLGKTKQVIEAIAGDIAAGVLGGALIVCPNSLKATWAHELEKHSELRYSTFGAGRRARRDAFRELTAQVFVINYEAVARELPALRALLRFRPMALVLDESHRIKTPGTAVTRAIHALARDARKRFLLSGTPVANTPSDLWSQLFFLDGGASVGETFEQFSGRFGSVEAGFADLDVLRARLAGIGLRRTKASALTLPTKTVTRVAIELRGRQRSLYEAMRDDLVVWVEALSGEQVAARGDEILARMLRLAQLASNPALIDAGYRETPAKFEALDALVDRQVSSGGKIIVWSSFVANVVTLHRRYTSFGSTLLHGEMSQPDRDRSVASFTSDVGTRVLVANPMVAREGLTLTVANVAAYVDRTFSLVDYLQSQDRIHRLSQTRPCEIVLLLASNTIDEFVDYSLEQKRRLAAFTQGDAPGVTAEDASLRKPDVLRALLGASRVGP